MSKSETDFNLYKKTLTFNVITRYDPNIQHLLYHTSHCQLYQYSSTSSEWTKLEHSGVLALYSRDTVSNQHHSNKDDIYTHGIIILNKTSSENFSLGLLSNSDSLKYGISEIKSENQTDYIIVKNLIGELYGFWVHDENDRIILKSIIDKILQGIPIINI